MDYLNNTINTLPRERGQHLRFEDRCEIKALHKQGYSYRQIAKALNCSPSTVGYELKRGTATKTTHRGRPTEYVPSRGQAVYYENRKRSGRKQRITSESLFAIWVAEQVKKANWSLDVCAGYAKKHNLFTEEELVCAKTLYNALNQSRLPLSLFDVPELLSRKKSKPKQAKNVRIFGRSIDERPDIVKLHLEIGHWEIDTIVGKRKGKEAVVLTLVEKVAHKFIAIKIRRKDVASVKAALRSFKIYYGSQFATVFKTITADNGTEFAELSQLERYGIMVYFAHPYSSYERAQNERHNRIFRKYVPKGKSIENYSAEQILWFAEDMNSLPRKSLGYDTPDDLFEAYLDTVYAA